MGTNTVKTIAQDLKHVLFGSTIHLIQYHEQQDTLREVNSKLEELLGKRKVKEINNPLEEEMDKEEGGE